jgi:hypothetical protein
MNFLLKIKTFSIMSGFAYVTSSLDGDKDAAAISGDYIYTSTNSGVTWSEQIKSGERNWSSIAMSNDGTIIVASVYGGYLWLSTDGGDNWSELTSGDSRNWNSISMNADGTIIAGSVYNGYIYISTDQGQTWEKQTSLGTGEWTSLAVSSSSTTCFMGSTLVTMKDGSKRMICEIKRGDEVLVDKETRKTNIVAKNLSNYITGEFILLEKDLIGNSREIVCTRVHPFWVNNGQNRVLAKDITGHKLVNRSEIFYNLQFEDEGSYYVEDIKVDSVGPNHKKFKLDKKLFFNKEKYTDHFDKNEDDKERQKPRLIKKYP